MVLFHILKYPEMIFRKTFAMALLFVFYANPLNGQDIGWLKAQAIRDNVVSIKSDYGVGFGLIVGEKDNTLWIGTANHVVRGPNDGGPNDRANVLIEFFAEQGNTYSAVLAETWLSSQREDLAVITITTPPRFKWRHEGFAPERENVAETFVWYVGRDGKWEVSELAGKITAKASDNKYSVEGFEDIAVEGMSGGVIVSEYGVEGLIQGRGSSGELKVISLASVKNFMKAWGHPWGMEGIGKRFSEQEKMSALGKELVVADNDTLRISRAQATIIVEKFSMGINSVIEFDSDVQQWSITAFSASFSKNAWIDGRGWNGYNGHHGEAGYNGYDCEDGGDGTDGGDGGDGNNGVDITMKIGIASIDSLKITLSGGTGGLGGYGGHGGSGGNYSAYKNGGCDGGDAGNGGNCGNGGNGGNGGILKLDYFFLEDPEREINRQQIIFISKPGAGGGYFYPQSAGWAGSGGTSSGKKFNKGRPGRSGAHGRNGQPGKAGGTVMRIM